MNISIIKNDLTQRFGRTGLTLQKHSPEILLGVGLVGIVAAMVMVAKAASKQVELDVETDELISEVEVAHEQIDDTTNSWVRNDNNYNKDMAVAYVKIGLAYAKQYGPAVSVGLLSVAAILASHGVMARRQVAIVAAYNLLNEGFKNYRQRVVEELGEKQDYLFSNNLHEEGYTELVEGEGGKKSKVKKTRMVHDGSKPSIYSVFFDESNPNNRGDRLLNKAFILAQQNYLNDILIIRGHVFLNEAYAALGFPHTTAGSIVGWVLRDPEIMESEHRDGYIDFGLMSDDIATQEFMKLENPSVLLDFNVDGIMYDLI